MEFCSSPLHMFWVTSKTSIFNYMQHLRKKKEEDCMNIGHIWPPKTSLLRLRIFREHRLLVDQQRKSVVRHELAGTKRWVDKKDEKGRLQLRISSDNVDEKDSILQESFADIRDEGRIHSIHDFFHCLHLERITSPNSNQELNPLSWDQEKEFDILQSSSNLPNNDYHLEKIPCIKGPREKKTCVDRDGCGNTVERTTSPCLPEPEGGEDSNEDAMELEGSPCTDENLCLLC